MNFSWCIQNKKGACEAPYILENYYVLMYDAFMASCVGNRHRLSSLLSSVAQHFATANSSHSASETVLVSSLCIRWLKSPFRHDSNFIPIS